MRSLEAIIIRSLSLESNVWIAAKSASLRWTRFPSLSKIPATINFCFEISKGARSFSKLAVRAWSVGLNINLIPKLQWVLVCLDDNYNSKIQNFQFYIQINYQV